MYAAGLINVPETRYVLTTRADGDIIFKVELDGRYSVTTLR